MQGLAPQHKRRCTRIKVTQTLPSVHKGTDTPCLFTSAVGSASVTSMREPQQPHHAWRSSFSPTRSCGSQRTPVAAGWMFFFTGVSFTVSSVIVVGSY